MDHLLIFPFSRCKTRYMRNWLVIILTVLLPAMMLAQGPSDVKVVEQMPMFSSLRCASLEAYEQHKACADRAMLEFIYAQLTYPKKARRREIQGMAVVSFVVERDGSLTSAEVLRDPGGGTGDEALRVVQLMMDQPNWSPGIQDGEPVRVQFNLPIQFSLE